MVEPLGFPPPLSLMRIILSSLLALSLPAFGALETASPAFEVFPADVNLSNMRDRQSLVVRITEPNGVHREVTVGGEVHRRRSFEGEDRERRGAARGRRADDAEGRVSGQVHRGAGEGASRRRSSSRYRFRLDVMPVFMKARVQPLPRRGARAGWLPAFAVGLRSGWRSLSPHPRTGRPPHQSGDARGVDARDEGHGRRAAHRRQAVRERQRAGQDAASAGWRPARRTIRRTSRRRRSLEILPKKLVLESPGQKFRVTVRAHYSDGTDRDVTSLALFLTSNEGSAKIKDGVITTGQRGEAFVMARFATFTVGAQVIVIPKDFKYEWPQDRGAQLHRSARGREAQQSAHHARAGSATTRPSSAAPTSTSPACCRPSDEVTKFVADAGRAKARRRRSTSCCERKEFVDIWALKWSELLQIRTEQQQPGQLQGGAELLHLAARPAAKRTCRSMKIARKLISASGSNFENPAVELLPARDRSAEARGRHRAGVLRHPHPVRAVPQPSVRSLDDGRLPRLRRLLHADRPQDRAKIRARRSSSTAAAASRSTRSAIASCRRNSSAAMRRTPKARTAARCSPTGSPRRRILISRSTSPTSSGRNTWAAGIVEPVDDVRISNPASNPELLEALAKKLIEYNYDLRHIVRDICNSRTYQTTTRPNETNALDDRNFAKATIRRMRAEVMLDCISQVTETQGQVPRPARRRARRGDRRRQDDELLPHHLRPSRPRDDLQPRGSRADAQPGLHLINGTPSRTRSPRAA